MLSVLFPQFFIYCQTKKSSSFTWRVVKYFLYLYFSTLHRIPQIMQLNFLIAVKPRTLGFWALQISLTIAKVAQLTITVTSHWSIRKIEVALRKIIMKVVDVLQKVLLRLILREWSLIPFVQSKFTWRMHNSLFTKEFLLTRNLEVSIQISLPGILSLMYAEFLSLEERVWPSERLKSVIASLAFA